MQTFGPYFSYNMILNFKYLEQEMLSPDLGIILFRDPSKTIGEISVQRFEFRVEITAEDFLDLFDRGKSVDDDPVHRIRLNIVFFRIKFIEDVPDDLLQNILHRTEAWPYSSTTSTMWIFSLRMN